MSIDAKPKGKRHRPAHFTTEFQKWARSHVSSESCKRNGAKGFKSTLEKHGPEPAFNGARQYRLEKPSSNEVLMIGVLSRLGIAYEREYRLGDSLYTVDFYLTDTNQAIEVNSRIHTQLDIEKRERQAARKRELLRDLQIPCLFVWDTEMADDVEGVIRKVKSFIGRAAR